MKNIILCLLLFFTVQNSSHAQQKVSKEEIESLLVELDNAVSRKKYYQELHERKADSLEYELELCSTDQYILKCKELYEVLADYDGKRALSCLQRISNTHEYFDDNELHQWVALSQANIYCTMGLYHKALSIVNEIAPSCLSQEGRLHYYHTCCDIYGNISEYLSDEQIVAEEGNLMIQYFDSILTLQSEGVGRDIVCANKELFQNNPNKALQIVQSDISKVKGDDCMALCVCLANIYKRLEDNDRYTYYLAQVSINDIRNGKMEYRSLPYLVHSLYERGDIERAYRYLMCSMEDANAYPARNMAVEVTAYFPIINHAYKQRLDLLVASEKNKSYSLGIAFFLLAIAISTAFYLGWRHNSSVMLKKKNEELAEALEKANIAERVRSEFIQNMRHEIRTPLNAVVGFSSLISNEMSEEERALYQQYINDNTQQMLALLDDILDISNMEGGSFNFLFEYIDIDNLCQNVISRNRSYLNDNVEMRYESMRPGMKLCTDEHRVSQVLYNLISNACKNTTKGNIVLTMEHSVVDDTYRFIVTDTGCGVPPEKADVIFNHFEKLDRYSPGVGLGLYVCRLIARGLGGDIHLDLKYTGGARFVFIVPNHVEQNSDTVAIETMVKESVVNET